MTSTFKSHTPHLRAAPCDAVTAKSFTVHAWQKPATGNNVNRITATSATTQKRAPLTLRFPRFSALFHACQQPVPSKITASNPRYCYHLEKALRESAVDPFPHTPPGRERKQIADDTVSRCQNRSGTEPFSSFACVAP